VLPYFSPLQDFVACPVRIVEDCWWDAQLISFFCPLSRLSFCLRRFVVEYLTMENRSRPT
jgi:hypothetical protein